MEEVRKFVDVDPSICCRICHEAEFESSTNLEAPCSCSGTLKFAHRDCIQRWCNEKGNTTCEICLQKYEPCYSTPPPRKPVQNVDEVRLDVVGTEVNPAQEETETEYAEISFAADTSASICRLLGFTLTLLLLVRHLHAACIGGTGEDYPFSLLTLLVMRATGILLPMYIIMRTVDAIHNTIKRRHQVSEQQHWDMI